MEVVTRKYTVYSFAELSEEAKEVVRQWYLEGQCNLSDFFTDDCLYRLEELFPNSDLKVEYSLGYCQGDGFNIYGTICLNDILEHIADHFTAKERKFFRWIFDTYGNSYTMQSNRWYSYCICSGNDFAEDLIWNAECDYMRNIPVVTLERFSKLAGEFLDDLCGEFEQDGYRFFYEIEDDELEELCEANEWKFLASGKLFC